MAFSSQFTGSPWLNAQQPQKASGLLGLLGVQSNPFTDFLSQHSNALVGLGAGLAGGGPDIGQAIGQGLQLGGQGKTADFARSEKVKADTTLAKNQTLTQQWLAKNRPDLANLPVDQAWQLAMKDQGSQGAAPSSVQEYQFYADQEKSAGRDPKPYGEWRAGGNQTSRAGLGQPVYIRNKNDPSRVLGIQPMTTGPGVDLMTGQPVPDPENWVVDPIGIAGDRAGAIKDAGNAASARASLPSAQNAYDQTLAVLQKFDPASPGADQSVIAGEGENFGNFLGIPQQMLPSLPKTNRANFQNVVDQLSGQAFLNIRQALKGAGQVTDYEGQKGEIALSRMSAAARSGDDKAFQQALIDYRTAIDNGMRLLREQAQGGFSEGQPALGGSPPAAAGGTGDPDLDRALQQYGQ